MISEGAVREYHHEFGPDYGEELEGKHVRVIAYSWHLDQFFVIPTDRSSEDTEAGWWAFETELLAPTFRGGSC